MGVRFYRTTYILLLHAFIALTLAWPQDLPQAGSGIALAKAPGGRTEAAPDVSNPLHTSDLTKSAVRSTDADAVDESTDPCVDFYQYACGNWMKNNPIPPDYPEWLSFAELYEHNLTILRKILESASRPDPRRDPLSQKIGDFYASCMDEEGVNKAGWSPIKPEMNRLEAIEDNSQLIEFLGHATLVGVHPIFRFWSAPDPHDPNRVIGFLGDGNLTLPSKDDYQREDPDMVLLRQKFTEHMKKMFVLVGHPPEVAARNAEIVLRIETRLARAATDRSPHQNSGRPEKTWSVQQINALAPNLHLEGYLAKTGAPPFTTLNVSNPDFFRQVSSLLENTPLQDWKVYVTWQILHDAAAWLSVDLLREDFSFRQALNGTKDLPPRWKLCISAVDSSLGEGLGRVYVKETFGVRDKQRILKIAGLLEKVLAHKIGELQWLTPSTRKEAQVKFASVRNKIGYPDVWRDYTALTISRGDFFGNLRRTAFFESNRQFHKIGRPPDKAEWVIAPSAVNAYYSPDLNEIVLPAGILQPPFFDSSLDEAANFGAIGFVIGHELTHGFDSGGWKFDSTGARREWWSAGDRQQYEMRSRCIADEYASFVAVDEQHLDGRLTLYENMADNRGAQLALIAMHDAVAKTRIDPSRKIDDRAYDQRFFLRFARALCENSTPELSRLAVRADPHSPGRWRVNGVVRNMPSFQNAFGCKLGQPMAPQNACNVW